MRPSELALDETPTAPVLQHAVRWLEHRGAAVDLVVLLQPTSPFRTAEHVDRTVELVHQGTDSAVSVCEVEHSPHWMFRLDGHTLEPLLPGPLNAARRQALPTLYRLNGAVYVARRRLLMDEGRVVGDRPAALVMSRRESIDIEDELDFEWAEWMCARGR
jgi:N-acylneuraminate cytidylyltransferase/CMP-N,N'-diacetyllegionaminic acid synthase